MKQKYLSGNIDNVKFTLNVINSPCIGNEKKHCKIHPIITFFRLAEILFPQGRKTKSAFFTKKTLLILNFLFFSLLGFSQTVINQEKFEINDGIWVGASTNKVFRTTTDPYEGKIALGFRGDGTLTSNVISTTAYNKIDVVFYVIGHGLTTGITMNLQYRSNSNASWTTVRTYTADANKDIRTNGNYYAFYATLFSTDYLFTTNSQFKFETNGLNGNNYLVIDNISIIGTTYNTITKGPGGITNDLETWLKADKVNGFGPGTDGAIVNS